MSHNEYAQQMAYDKEQEELKSVKLEGTKCEDCDVVNAEVFSYYMNRCNDCCIKRDRSNREYEKRQRWELIITYLKKEWGEPKDEEWEEILGWAKDYDETNGISVDMMQKECRDEDLNDFIAYKSENYYSLKDFLGY